MIKNLVSSLDYGVFAEVSLAIFAIVFVAVVARTLLTQNAITSHQANIVLDDPAENQQ